MEKQRFLGQLVKIIKIYSNSSIAIFIPNAVFSEELNFKPVQATIIILKFDR